MFDKGWSQYRRVFVPYYSVPKLILAVLGLQIVWAILASIILGLFSEATRIPLRGVSNISFLLCLSYVFRPLKSRLAYGATETLKRDHRKPVLYLRSFRDDGKHNSGQGRGIWFDDRRTFEERLAGELRRVGPVIAIGRPGEKLPPVGAARFYCQDKNWQREVSSLIKKSQRIIMTLGSSEGFCWEFLRVIDLEAKEKVILLFPPIGDVPLNQRWKKFVSQISAFGEHGLPKTLDKNVCLMTFNKIDKYKIYSWPRGRRRAQRATYLWGDYRRCLRSAIGETRSDAIA